MLKMIERNIEYNGFVAVDSRSHDTRLFTARAKNIMILAMVQRAVFPRRALITVNNDDTPEPNTTTRARQHEYQWFVCAPEHRYREF